MPYPEPVLDYPHGTSVDSEHNCHVGRSYPAEPYTFRAGNYQYMTDDALAAMIDEARAPLRTELHALATRIGDIENVVREAVRTLGHCEVSTLLTRALAGQSSSAAQDDESRARVKDRLMQAVKDVTQPQMAPMVMVQAEQWQAIKRASDWLSHMDPKRKIEQLALAELLQTVDQIDAANVPTEREMDT